MISHKTRSLPIKIALPEWFDLDREEKIVKNVTFDDVFGQSQREGWEQPPVRCPHCGNGAVIYGNEDAVGNHYDNFWLCSCSWCDEEWEEDFIS